MPDSNFAYRYEELKDNIVTKRTLKSTEYGKVNDVFLFSNHDNMLKYFSALEISFEKLWHLDLKKTESYVGYHIKKCLKIKRDHISKKMGLYRTMSERVQN